MARNEHWFGRRVLEPDAAYGIVVPVTLIECHLADGREDLAGRADRGLRGFLGGENVNQQVEERFPVNLADPQVANVRDDVVLGHVALLLASGRAHRVVAQEALFTELRDRHRGLAGRARLFQESARVTLFLVGHLVSPLVRVISTRGLVLAVRYRRNACQIDRLARSRMPPGTSLDSGCGCVRRNVRTRHRQQTATNSTT
jgi:hypothetical protein